MNEAGPGETLYGKLARLAARKLPVKPFRIRNSRPVVSFTFDDCFASAIEVGASILDRAGVRGTYFAAGGLDGGVSHGARLYNVEQLRRLSAAGHEVGCHSTSHDAFVSRKTSWMQADWNANADFLRSQVGLDEIYSFSYPYGYYDIRACVDASRRFVASRGGRPGINQGWVDLLKLLANPMGPGQAHLETARKLIEQTRREGGWLIFYTHDISDQPSAFGCTPRNFQSLVDQVIAEGIEVLTIKNAVGSISSPRA